MATPRLEVRDVLGERFVSVDRLPFTIGRRETNDLRLGGSEVSREHAEIALEEGKYVLRDKASRYGTFVNGEPASECDLKPGDRIRLGRGGGADLVFLSGESEISRTGKSTTGARDDLRQITVLLEGFRALGSGRVLQEVLALVLDASIEISGAERAFIMLAGSESQLEFKLARGRSKMTLTDSTFQISRKIPEEVYRLGKTRVVADLLDGDTADVHMGTLALGIRNVICVPLNFVRYVEAGEARGDDQRIGVLYLDSRERGSLLSDATRGALETLAGEASVAIENARLYRDKLEKARMEQEMRIAAEIQQSLLPRARVSLGYVEAAAASIPCRSIGGDFFDYVENTSRFGFALGDVAGKGPPAALMSALMQGMYASQAQYADGPASAVTSMNKALCRRGLESRFVTLMFGSIGSDGSLTYCNAGHNPPFVIGKSGVKRLGEGGPVVGLLEFAPYDQESVQLEAGDTVIVFSDGVSEALNSAGDEYGDDRLEVVATAGGDAPPPVIVERIIASVREFTKGAPQSDDITVMVVRYLGAGN
ncbi:MAG TPA: SpoIIE family protein phosphatase [Vicinamibacterales bacterium]|nr:SpoIIE family protein phosphatase [Vicinamibacterales bacterium]